MRKNESDANKRVVGPIPFYNLSGALLTGQTFAAAGETAIFNLTSGTFTDTTTDALEAATTGMYYVPLSQAEVNFNSFLIVRLRKSTFDDQYFIVPIDNTPDVNVVTVASDAIDATALAGNAVTEIQAGLATATALATVGTNVSTIITNIGTPSVSIAADIAAIDFDTSGLEADIADVKSDTAAIVSTTGSIQATVATLLKIGVGRWKITGEQLILYDTDEVTPLYTFDLLDDEGDPSQTRIFERLPA